MKPSNNFTEKTESKKRILVSSELYNSLSELLENGESIEELIESMARDRIRVSKTKTKGVVGLQGNNLMNEEFSNQIKNLSYYKTMNCFNAYQIERIAEGLERNLNVEIYAKTEFNSNQMLQIRLGLVEKLDVSIYADSDFTWDQMEQIRLGLKDGLDASSYANNVLYSFEMKNARLKLAFQKEKKDSAY